MTKASFIRRGFAMFPVDEDGEAIIRAIKDGAECMGEFRPARRPKQHRTYFALLKLLVDNTDAFPNVEAALRAVKLALGEVDEFTVDNTGQVVWVLRSIAFESCDQARFSKLFDDTLELIVNRWLIGTDAEELRQRVFDIVDPADAPGKRIPRRVTPAQIEHEREGAR